MPWGQRPGPGNRAHPEPDPHPQPPGTVRAGGNLAVPSPSFPTLGGRRYGTRTTELSVGHEPGPVTKRSHSSCNRMMQRTDAIQDGRSNDLCVEASGSPSGCCVSRADAETIPFLALKCPHNFHGRRALYPPGTLFRRPKSDLEGLRVAAQSTATSLILIDFSTSNATLPLGSVAEPMRK